MTTDMQVRAIAREVQARLASIGIDCSVSEETDVVAFGVAQIESYTLNVSGGAVHLSLSREDETSMWFAIYWGGTSGIELWPFSDSATLVELLLAIVKGPLDEWRNIFGRSMGIKVSFRGRTWRFASQPTI